MGKLHDNLQCDNAAAAALQQVLGKGLQKYNVIHLIHGQLPFYWSTEVYMIHVVQQVSAIIWKCLQYCDD